MAELQLKDVRKSFGAVDVIKGVSLEVKSGEFMVFVGPSGCGKSTLLRLIAGLEDITSGTLSFDGEVVNGLAPSRRGVAMVFQSYALYPHMTVFDNMAYGLKIKKMPSAEIRMRVDKAAQILGLDGLLQRKPRELSGGQRQRVAMGRAIVRQPQAFLFDEPLSNLDAKLRAQTRLEIEKLHRELHVTSLFVTHDQVEAMTLAERMIVMNAGRMEQFGTPDDVYHHPASTFVAGFIGAPPMNLLTGVAGVRDGVILGVRPEHLQVVDSGAWSVLVDTVEMLGAERLIYGHLHGPQGPFMIVRMAATEGAPSPGQTLHVQPRRDCIHGFDATSGLRIEG